MADNLVDLIRQVAYLKAGGGRKSEEEQFGGLLNTIGKSLGSAGEGLNKVGESRLKPLAVQKTMADIEETKAKAKYYDEAAGGRFLFINPVTREVSETESPGFIRVSANTAASIAAQPGREEAGLKNKQTGEQNELLSPTEALALGVPYGTKKADAKGKIPERPPTDAQLGTNIYANRTQQANNILNQLEQYASGANPATFDLQTRAPDFLNVLKSNDFQSLEQAKRNFLNSVLRKESGAVISPSEMAEGNRQYFPIPGDSPQTLSQKRANREIVIQGLIKASGSGYSNLLPTVQNSLESFIANPQISEILKNKARAAKAKGIPEDQIISALKQDSGLQ